jgi:citrate lyase subunit beta/citryl-CoA lyase
VNCRSMLFAVGCKERQCAKALGCPTDMVIFDLEDAVSESMKSEARGVVAGLLGCNASGSPDIVVRVNGLQTALAFGDLQAVVKPGLFAVMLPKVQSAADIHILDWMLTELERERALGEGSVGIIPIIETAAGVVNSQQIAAATRRIPFLTFGAGDFSLDIQSSRGIGNPALIWARIQIVIASRLAGLAMPVDTVYPRLDDPDGLKLEAELARDLGYQGKACIHPAQLQTVNQTFGPDPDEIESARNVVVAFDEAVSNGEASILVDGRLVDYAVAAAARKVLRRSRDRE